MNQFNPYAAMSAEQLHGLAQHPALENIARQKAFIEGRQGDIAQLAAQPVQSNAYLAPLAQLTDTWTGSNFSKQAQAMGDSANERLNMIQKIENSLSNSEGSLNRSTNDLMDAALREKLAKRLMGQQGLALQKEAQGNRIDFMKSEPAKNTEALGKLQDSLNRYEKIFDEVGGAEVTGANAKKLQEAYSDVLIQSKEAAALGALTGPDMSLMEQQLPRAAGVGGAIAYKLSGGKEGFKNSIKGIKSSIYQKAQKNITALDTAFPDEVTATLEQKNRLKGMFQAPKVEASEADIDAQLKAMGYE